MADTFITYRSFNDKAFTIELFLQTQRGRDPSRIENRARYFDVSFSCNELLNKY